MKRSFTRRASERADHAPPNPPRVNAACGLTRSFATRPMSHANALIAIAATISGCSRMGSPASGLFGPGRRISCPHYGGNSTVEFLPFGLDWTHIPEIRFSENKDLPDNNDPPRRQKVRNSTVEVTYAKEKSCI